MNIPTLEDVQTAAARIAGVAVRTPLLRSDALDNMTGAKVWLKAECLQRTGSFKFRGAWNRLSALTPEQRREGVVAFSSGNHAQGVALAAKLLGIRATIVMPSDAPRIKVDATRGHGAEVVSYDRLRDPRDAIAAKIVSERGGVIVAPFNDPYVVAGQGTAGLEIAEEIGQPDIALVCCGGGGLASGIALALPESEIVVVEPEAYDDVMRSLASGVIEPVRDPGPTLCDALQTLVTSPLTFGILQARGAHGIAVSDADVKAAMAFAFRTLKLVVEPGGAAALAAALSGKLDLKGKTVAITLSGGNVDAETYRVCLGV
ncbi:threonine ammonia-lyase [Sphingosinicella microcystinivorans]|uniref:L-threonine ammonia-lyase n=1 Tax=Sphingosinicella microcystinivorans TaxID=335406 RepID=A0AAD1D746_SPHMI|nr:threonine/serine dehydratase [Sphingosinicella microcystinivorans]RKS91954.1 L-threonine ammonia-lyase [Sphingosinicella microcystinivorans]BBE34940.1 serine/threonine dehydratase [Sphingosinicella microcystinivorans]